MSETNAETSGGKPPGRAGRKIVVAIVILAVVGGVYYLQIKPPKLDKRWGNDLTTAQDTAAKTKRPVIVFFHADPPGQEARKLVKETFRVSQTTKALDRGQWLCVELALPEKLESPQARQFKLAALPTILLLAPDGKELKRATGFIGAAALEQMMYEARVQAGLVNNPSGS